MKPPVRTGGGGMIDLAGAVRPGRRPGPKPVPDPTPEKMGAVEWSLVF